MECEWFSQFFKWNFKIPYTWFETGHCIIYWSTGKTDLVQSRVRLELILSSNWDFSKGRNLQHSSSLAILIQIPVQETLPPGTQTFPCPLSLYNALYNQPCYLHISPTGPSWAENYMQNMRKSNKDICRTDLLTRPIWLTPLGNPHWSVRRQPTFVTKIYLSAPRSFGIFPTNK